MIARVLIVAALIAVAAFAVWHPAPHPAVVALSPAPGVAAATATISGPFSHRRRSRFKQLADGASESEPVVYVAGAVRRPGLYRLRAGDRYDRAVALAGGFGPDADATGVNLAQRAADGEEVLVPRVGDTPYTRTGRARAAHHRRHGARTPPEGSVDVNAAGAEDLARVPGIGRAIAGRIIEVRDREGAFASLDELLDVAGMTQSRLERARPYLRDL